MGFKELISSSVSTVNKNLSLVGITGVIYVSFMLLSLLFEPQNLVALDGQTVDLTSTYVFGGLFILLSIFLEGGVIQYLYQNRVASGSAHFSTLLDSGKKNYGKLFLLGLFAFVFAMVTFFATVIAGSLSVIINPLIAIAVAVLLGAFGLYCCVVVFFLAPYPIVLDQQKIGAALKTSLKLSRKNLFAFLVIVLLVVAIRYGGSVLLSTLIASTTIALKTGITDRIITAMFWIPIDAYCSVFMFSIFMHFYLNGVQQTKESLAQN